MEEYVAIWFGLVHKYTGSKPLKSLVAFLGPDFFATRFAALAAIGDTTVESMNASTCEDR